MRRGDAATSGNDATSCASSSSALTTKPAGHSAHQIPLCASPKSPQGYTARSSSTTTKTSSAWTADCTAARPISAAPSR
nr:MAG TPA: hypothetical protein [Caudoviricetes sp.]